MAETIALTLDAVRRYDGLGEDIYPYGERDMGRLTVGDEDYYWKIDYYDRNLEFHSPDPADPSVAIRVLRIDAPFLHGVQVFGFGGRFYGNIIASRTGHNPRVRKAFCGFLWTPL